MKAVRPVIASNKVPYLEMKSVGSHILPGMEKEGKKGRTRWVSKRVIHILFTSDFDTDFFTLSTTLDEIMLAVNYSKIRILRRNEFKFINFVTHI